MLSFPAVSFSLFHYTVKSACRDIWNFASSSSSYKFSDVRQSVYYLSKWQWFAVICVDIDFCNWFVSCLFSPCTNNLAAVSCKWVPLCLSAWASECSLQCPAAGFSLCFCVLFLSLLFSSSPPLHFLSHYLPVSARLSPIHKQWLQWSSMV